MLVLRTSPCCSLHTVLSCILANPVLWAEALLGLPHRTQLWCLTCGLPLGPSAPHTTLGCLHALLEKLWGAKKTEHPFHVFPYIKLYYIKLNLKGGKMGKRALTFPTHCLLLSLSDLSSAFTNLWTLKNLLPPNDSKLLQNRGANEARPTQCFLHLSRRPSNEITSSAEPSFACGWPLPGDPAVILWVSRTLLARMLGVSSNSYPSPESEPLGVKLSLICTHWHHNLNRFLQVFLGLRNSTGSCSQLIATHTQVWDEQRAAAPAATNLNLGSVLAPGHSKVQGAAPGSEHSALPSAQAAGGPEDGWHAGSRRQAPGSGISSCAPVTVCIVFCFAKRLSRFFCSTKSCYLNCEWIERPWVNICVWKGLVRTA